MLSSMRRVIAIAVLLAATHAAGQSFDPGAAVRQMRQVQTLIEQRRFDEAEVLARELDARHGAGKSPWMDMVRMSRNAPEEAPLPDPLFLELGTTFDLETMKEHVASTDTPGGLNQRGIDLHRSGKLAAAIDAYEQSERGFRALAAQPDAETSGHRYNIHLVAANLGVAYWQQGQLAQARDAFQRALDERADFEGSGVTPYRSEKDMLRLAQLHAQELNAIISLERELGADSRALGLQALLDRKGTVLQRQAQALAELRRSVQGSSNPLARFTAGGVADDLFRAEDKERLAALEDYSRQRAELANLPPASGAEQAERSRRMAELDQRIQGLKAGIQGQVFARQQAREGPNFAQAIGSLFGKTKTQEDFEAEYQQRDAKKRAHSRATRAAMLQQIRATLPAGGVLLEMVKYRSFDPRRSGEARWGSERYGAYVITAAAEPVYVDLGEAQAIERLVRDFRRALGQDQGNAKSLARRVDEAVMRPIRAAMGQAATLYVAPEGVLNLVPLAALVDEEGRFLVERYTINYLGSGRELLQQARDQARGPATVIADPQFNLTGVAAAPPAGSRSVDFTRVKFDPLPGTAGEARALSKLLPDAVTIMGEQATETAAKRLTGPRILHIATHGFFLEDAPAAGGAGRSASREPEDPMLRSGLVFAGVNRLRSGDDDGVLTALEAASLDLRGTRLVVLSACETGLGEVRNGEGVFGLRRAFAVAGAETLVMSLWQVADDATMELMAGYYSRLAQGMPRAEALRQAQLALLRRPGTAAPYYWAAFISSGQAGPLQ